MSEYVLGEMFYAKAQRRQDAKEGKAVSKTLFVMVCSFTPAKQTRRLKGTKKGTRGFFVISACAGMMEGVGTGRAGDFAPEWHPSCTLQTCF